MTVWHGLPLDLSCAGYFTIFPALFLALSSVWKIPIRILDSYFVVALSLIFWIVIPDIDVYGYWGAHMDAPSILFYLRNPGDVASSFTPVMVVRDLSLIAICFAGSYFFYRRWIGQKAERLPEAHPLTGAVIVAIASSLFFPIRGGLSTATMNVGRVYFSQNNFLNHAAINPVWNFMDSFQWRRDFGRQYRFMEDETAAQLFGALSPDRDARPRDILLTTKRPNIILIMLESFSGNFIEPLGGAQDVTPRLNELFETSIAFTNIYASGTRTDSGIVAILGGYPAQPRGRIMARPDKSLHLPSLPKVLKAAGYELSFYYGGDENFANMRAYLVGNGFDKIVGEGHFSPKEVRTKWGVYDEVLFARLRTDLNSWNSRRSEKPFFKVALTLTSHEPFTLPVAPHFPGDGLLEKYKSSLHYADNALGDFLDFARGQPWWQDTLVVLIADHGTPLPNFKIHEPARYRIPMLWTGGAIASPERIASIGSQTDLCATLLAQLGFPHTEFPFSKDLLAPHGPEYAFYTFSNGFGFVEPALTTSFDCGAGKSLLSEGDETGQGLLRGQAYLQTLYDDLEGRRSRPNAADNR
ncbi:MAG: LTA synthase family protein [Myxococcales bacterium]|nr:LTA synthase family protein [Myxococcales bacterium]